MQWPAAMTGQRQPAGELTIGIVGPHDLRSGIALILAGLCAEGETVVAPGYLIDRGHAAVAERLTTLGADISIESSG